MDLENLWRYLLISVLHFIQLKRCEGQSSVSPLTTYLKTTALPDDGLISSPHVLNITTPPKETPSQPPMPIKTQPKETVITTTPTNSSNSNNNISIVLFQDWRFLVALVCFEVFAYCATLFIIFGMQNKRARGKRFGTFSWKGRKGADKAKTIIA